MKGRLPNVSFIIPTLNAASHLPNLIQSIKIQSYPENKIEIIVADGGSTDETLEFCKKNKIIVIQNPSIIHEAGKVRAANHTTGDILFYTDADNVLANPDWIRLMVQPYMDHPGVRGFLPQTLPPPDSHPLNRYLGYLFTDPFTWFIYGPSANPKNYRCIPRFKTDVYSIFNFNPYTPPLFGLSQGAGTVATFDRSNFPDDITAGLELIKQHSLIAYVPGAGIFHYHVNGFQSFIQKYRARIRNNLHETYTDMGFTQRQLPLPYKIRAYLFLPYVCLFMLPIYDSLKLTVMNRDPVMLYHIPATLLLAGIMLEEIFLFYAKKIIRSLH